jgi:hypothetical protein
MYVLEEKKHRWEPAHKKRLSSYLESLRPLNGMMTRSNILKTEVQFLSCKCVSLQSFPKLYASPLKDRSWRHKLIFFDTGQLIGRINCRTFPKEKHIFRSSSPKSLSLHVIWQLLLWCLCCASLHMIWQLLPWCLYCASLELTLHMTARY